MMMMMMMMMMICCTARVVAIDGRQDVNVALNRQSCQVSTHAGLTSNLANDGNRETVISAGSCMHTESETNPWWAVDLVVALYVAVVRFTNRNDAGMYVDTYNITNCQC